MKGNSDIENSIQLKYGIQVRFYFKMCPAKKTALL